MAKYCAENTGGDKKRAYLDSTPKPKILHLASDLSSGGAERVFANTIEQSVATNLYEIFVASCDESPPFSIDENHFLRLDDWNNHSKIYAVFKYIFNFANFTHLKRFLFCIKPNIIHTQNYLSRISPSVLFALRSYKRAFPQTRLIFTQHGYGVCANLCLYNYAKNKICEDCIDSAKWHIAFKNCDRRGKIYSVLKALRVPFYQGIFLKEQNLFDKIIFVSEFQASKHRLEGYKNSIVIPNPIEYRFYDSVPNLSQKQNVIVFFGRIAKEKNIPLLIRAFAKFCEQNSGYKLIIIGNGDEKEKCERLARELGIDSATCKNFAESNMNFAESSIIFIPHLPPNKLKDILRIAKISVLPSLLYETFGLSIVEGILAGVVPIASDIGALRETIDKYYGFVFENNNEASLAGAMEKVLGNYERYFAQVLKIQQKIVAENKQYMENLLDLYK